MTDGAQCIVPTLIVIRVGLGLQWQKAKLEPGRTVESVGANFNFLTAPSFNNAGNTLSVPRSVIPHLPYQYDSDSSCSSRSCR